MTTTNIQTAKKRLRGTRAGNGIVCTEHTLIGTVALYYSPRELDLLGAAYSADGAGKRAFHALWADMIAAKVAAIEADRRRPNM